MRTVPCPGINGTAYQTLKHATPAQCCAACKADKCDAWSMADGLGADGKGDCQLMQDPMRYHRITDPCASPYLPCQQRALSVEMLHECRCVLIAAA